jgi:hypothetical protein
MSYNQNTAECAVEIAMTYPHAESYPDEVVGEYIDCGEPIPGITYYDLIDAVRDAFQLCKTETNYSRIVEQLINL